MPESLRPESARAPLPPGDPSKLRSSSEGADPAESPDVETAVDEQLDRMWNVIVWDDPINLMAYVTYVFQRLLGYSLAKATEHMMEVHNRGKSVVATVERERAENYVARLHDYGLQATLEKSIC